MAYGNVADMVAYLARSGRTLGDTLSASQALEAAADWIDAQECYYRSERVTEDSAWPRKAWNHTPKPVVYAAYELAWLIADGQDVWGGEIQTAGGQVTREKVDVLEVQYAAPTFDSFSSFADHVRVMIPRVYGLLCPYFRVGGSYSGLFVVSDGRCGEW